MTTENTLRLTEPKLSFLVRIVEQGGRYGLDDKLTHDKEDPLVEFYDERYPHTKYGQFVSRYYMSTLMEGRNGVGLCLQGGIDDWSVGADNMDKLRGWLAEQSKIVSAPKKQRQKPT